MFNERNTLNNIKVHKWKTPYVLKFLFSGFSVCMLFFLKCKLKKYLTKWLCSLKNPKTVYSQKKKHLTHQMSLSLVHIHTSWNFSYGCPCAHPQAHVPPNTHLPRFTKWGLYFFNLLLRELKKDFSLLWLYIYRNTLRINVTRPHVS